MHTTITVLLATTMVISVLLGLYGFFPGTAILLAPTALLAVIATHFRTPKILLMIPLAYCLSWQVLRYFSEWTPPSDWTSNWLLCIASITSIVAFSIELNAKRTPGKNILIGINRALVASFAAIIMIAIPNWTNGFLIDMFVVTPFGLPHTLPILGAYIGIPTGIVFSLLADTIIGQRAPPQIA